MLFNYLKVAFRTLLRHKGYALINIGGLAIAITSALMIYLYVQNEKSYDRFHPNAVNTYRVVTDFKFNDVLDHLALSPPPLGPALKKDYPEVELMTQFTQYNQGKTLVKAAEQRFYLENIFFADSNFFRIFPFHVLKGNIGKALTEPNCVVITENTAALYFGKTDPIDKILEFDRNDGTYASYKVTAVVEEQPKNSHIRFTALTSIPGLWQLYGEEAKQDWVGAFMYTYITLKNGTDYHSLQHKIKDLFVRNNPNLDQRGVKAACDYIIEPLTDIHLKSVRIWDIAVPGNNRYVNIFMIVAVFILLIAGINYINLTTARAATRMKEMGVRKVAGATKNQLMTQVMVEVFIVSAFALILAFGLSSLAIGFLADLTSVAFSISDILLPEFIAVILFATFLVSFLSGIYPAFYISKFDPAQVMKASLIELKQKSKWRGFTFRKALVVFQFSISVVMIVATIIVYRQLNYMLEKDPGFNKENVVSVMFQDTVVASQYNALKAELNHLSQVQSVSFSATIPGGPPDRKITRVEGKAPLDLVEIPTCPIFMDFEYQQLMGFKLKSGDFIKQDTGIGFRSAFLINEAAANKFGWKEPLGKRIIYGFGPRERDGKVIGVIQNIQTTSFKEPPEPMIFMVYTRPYAQTYISIKLKPGNMMAAMKDMEKVFRTFDPAHPFDPIILDANIKRLYEAEIKMSRLFTVFSVLTLFIACLGLLGLASFVTEQRTKEIGVRKVLGASVSNIVVLISRDFALLICIAFVLGIPVSWYAMHIWLQDFATRIEISYAVFLMAAISTLAIAWITIGFQTIKAAAFNPIKSLRYE